MGQLARSDSSPRIAPKPSGSPRAFPQRGIGGLVRRAPRGGRAEPSFTVGILRYHGQVLLPYLGLDAAYRENLGLLSICLGFYGGFRMLPILSNICISQNVTLTVPVVRVHASWVRHMDIITTAQFKIVRATNAWITHVMRSRRPSAVGTSPMTAKRQVLNEGAEGYQGGGQDGNAKLEDRAEAAYSQYI